MIVACCFGLCVPSIFISKANAKEDLGEYWPFHYESESEKEKKPQIFICNRVRADGIITIRITTVHWRSYLPSKFRVSFCQNGYFRRFPFLSRRIFSRILSPDLFSSFSWEKCPEKSSKKIPGKILQNLYNKNPRHISAEGPGQQNSAPGKWGRPRRGSSSF